MSISTCYYYIDKYNDLKINLDRAASKLDTTVAYLNKVKDQINENYEVNNSVSPISHKINDKVKSLREISSYLTGTVSYSIDYHIRELRREIQEQQQQ